METLQQSWKSFNCLYFCLDWLDKCVGFVHFSFWKIHFVDLDQFRVDKACNDLTTIQSFLNVEQIIFEIIVLVLNNEIKLNEMKINPSHFSPAFQHFDGTQTNQLASVCGSWCYCRLVKKSDLSFLKYSLQWDVHYWQSCYTCYLCYPAALAPKKVLLSSNEKWRVISSAAGFLSKLMQQSASLQLPWFLEQ